MQSQGYIEVEAAVSAALGAAFAWWALVSWFKDVRSLATGARGLALHLRVIAFAGGLIVLSGLLLWSSSLELGPMDLVQDFDTAGQYRDEQLDLLPPEKAERVSRARAELLFVSSGNAQRYRDQSGTWVALSPSTKAIAAREALIAAQARAEVLSAGMAVGAAALVFTGLLVGYLGYRAGRAQ